MFKLAVTHLLPVYHTLAVLAPGSRTTILVYLPPNLYFWVGPKGGWYVCHPSAVHSVKFIFCWCIVDGWQIYNQLFILKDNIICKRIIWSKNVVLLFNLNMGLVNKKFNGIFQQTIFVLLQVKTISSVDNAKTHPPVKPIITHKLAFYLT